MTGSLPLYLNVLFVVPAPHGCHFAVLSVPVIRQAAEIEATARIAFDNSQP